MEKTGEELLKEKTHSQWTRSCIILVSGGDHGLYHVNIFLEMLTVSIF